MPGGAGSEGKDGIAGPSDDPTDANCQVCPAGPRGLPGSLPFLRP